MRFALIVLNWNNAKDTLECLASLEKLDHSDYDVIVVDNGSTDGSLETIRAAYPHHTFLENRKNLGFAEGNNRGITLALKQKPDLLMLLNNDTAVHPKMLLEIEAVAAQYPEAGVFGPKIYFYDKPATTWYAGGGIDSKTGRCYHVGCGDPNGHNEVRKTGYACGCALAVKREVVEKVGLMDPRFFLLWEEIDWCTRIQKAGFQCLFVPRAKLWHKISASFPEGNRGPTWLYFYARGKLLYHQKHTQLPKRLKYSPALPKTPLKITFLAIFDHLIQRKSSKIINTNI